MKRSTFGKLRETLNNSGIDGAPIISDKELLELRMEMERLIDVAHDIKDHPLESYLNRELNTVINIIDARSHKY